MLRLGARVAGSGNQSRVRTVTPSLRSSADKDACFDNAPSQPPKAWAGLCPAIEEPGASSALVADRRVAARRPAL